MHTIVSKKKTDLFLASPSLSLCIPDELQRFENLSLQSLGQRDDAGKWALVANLRSLEKNWDLEIPFDIDATLIQHGFPNDS